MIYWRLLNIVDKTHFTNKMFGAGNPDKANGGLVVCVKQVAHEKKLLLCKLRAGFFRFMRTNE